MQIQNTSCDFAYLNGSVTSIVHGGKKTKRKEREMVSEGGAGEKTNFTPYQL
jgi:hypothetical protein